MDGVLEFVKSHFQIKGFVILIYCKCVFHSDIFIDVHHQHIRT